LKVCILGLGEIGLPTAKYIQDKGIMTWGYDINNLAIERAKKNGLSNVTNIWLDIPPQDIYIICVSTTLKNNKPDLSAVTDVMNKISSINNGSKLVSIESTIVPGYSKHLFNTLFEKKGYLVHVPHRFWGEDVENHGVNQQRVIGAINSESLEYGLHFYEDILQIPLSVSPSIEIAEMCKIVENAHRYVEISFAEELKILCHDLKINFDEVRKACNTKWNTEILEARDGIGGHCLPKDIRYLISLTNKHCLLSASLKTDKIYKDWLNNKITLKKAEY